jgi:hypothetical protein
VDHLRETWIASKLALRTKHFAANTSASKTDAEGNHISVGPPKFQLTLSTTDTANAPSGSNRNQSTGGGKAAATTNGGGGNQMANPDTARRPQQQQLPRDQQYTKSNKQDHLAERQHQRQAQSHEKESGHENRAADKKGRGRGDSRVDRSNVRSSESTHSQPNKSHYPASDPNDVRFARKNEAPSSHEVYESGGGKGDGGGRGGRGGRGHDRDRDRDADPGRGRGGRGRGRGRGDSFHDAHDRSGAAADETEFDFPDLGGSASASASVVRVGTSSSSSAAEPSSQKHVLAEGANKIIASSLGIKPSSAQASTAASHLADKMAAVSLSDSRKTGEVRDGGALERDAGGRGHRGRGRDRGGDSAVNRAAEYSLVDFATSKGGSHSAKGSSSGGKVAANWSCSACTFSNHGSLRVCEICGNKK